jgi:hypothetical protein
VESGKFWTGSYWTATPWKNRINMGKPARKSGLKRVSASHNISGQPSNGRPTNGVFGVKKPEFVVVQK